MPDLSEAGHLPQQRPDRGPADPDELPRQRRGTTPQMHGRYPDYDVLENRDHWDAVTREVVMARVEAVPQIRFFTPQEEAPLRAFCDRVMAQDREPKIPVLELVDDKLHAGRLDGFQHAGMPDDRDTWRRVARELGSFHELSWDEQGELCERFSKGELDFGDMDCSKAWGVVMRGILQSFYAHPWAWNEIGFGGPAYPRGYSRLGFGRIEAWEGQEAFQRDPVTEGS
ncbi:MAG TPA: gluconate 2-dehydrogenase subunit 3 family protein [Longimicrobiales bacterium]|nr:gluconate 2-dehydrogenase subunit 3 family protein [Longimicrobiales bacterium]